MQTSVSNELNNSAQSSAKSRFGRVSQQGDDEFFDFNLGRIALCDATYLHQCNEHDDRKSLMNGRFSKHPNPQIYTC